MNTANTNPDSTTGTEQPPVPQGGSFNPGQAPGPQPANDPIPSAVQNFPPPPPPQQTVMPETPVSQETFVVTPQGSDIRPQGTADAPSSGSGGGSFVKKIMMILLLCIVLAGFGAGGWYLFGLMRGPENVTIQYWGLWEEDAIILPVIEAFESKYPNITVEYTKQNHKQYRERLQYQLEKETGPDVFRFHNTWVSMFRTQLDPVPQEIMTPGEFSSVFYPVASGDLVAGETVFGIPLMVDGLGLYYNEDLFAAAGVVPPATYEELSEIVPRLTVRNGEEIITSAIALGATGNVEHFSDIVATLMLQNGANLIDPTGSRAEGTLTFYRKFSDPSDPLYTWNARLDNSISAFANGRVAMIFAPSWRAHDIALMNPNLRFRIVPIPQLSDNTVTWASYWVEGVSRASVNKKEAWEFVRFLTSRESAQTLYTEASKTRLFGEPFARIDMGSSLADDPYVGAYIAQAPDAKSFPLASRTHDNGINDAMIKYLEDAVNSVLSGSAPSGALQTASQGFRQVLTRYGLSGNSL